MYLYISQKKGQISISVHFWAAEVEALLCRQLVLLQREFPPSVGALKPGVREVFRPGLEAFEAPGALVVASWCRLGAREGWHWLNGAWMGGGRGLKSTFFAYFRNFFAWNQISNRSRLKYFENCSKTEQLRHFPSFFFGISLMCENCPPPRFDVYFHSTLRNKENLLSILPPVRKSGSPTTVTSVKSTK